MSEKERSRSDVLFLAPDSRSAGGEPWCLQSKQCYSHTRHTPGVVDLFSSEARVADRSFDTQAASVPSVLRSQAALVLGYTLGSAAATAVLVSIPVMLRRALRSGTWTRYTYGPGCCVSSTGRKLTPWQRCSSEEQRGPAAVRPVSLSAAPCTGTADAARLERRRQSSAPQSISIGLQAKLHGYLVSVGVRSSPELSALHAATCELGPVARNISPPDTVSLLQMLVRLVKAERVLEIGVFTGFTALGMALALPAHGRLIGCELEEKWTEMAKPYWKAAGVSDRIELRIGAASQTLASVYTQSHMLALRPARCLQL